MPESAGPAYKLAPDEKVAQIMVYTVNNLVWGDVIVKNAVRVSTWLKTNMAPDTICLYNAKLLSSSTSTASVHPMALPELHVSASQVLVYLMVPPAKDPLDYDPKEPNRRMDAITVMAGPARIDGFMRFAAVANLSKYLEVNKENFTPIYDAELTNLAIPSLRAIHVQYLLVRQATSLFMFRPA